MKIAFLCWTVPYPVTSGGKSRSYHLLRYLAARHEVHLHVPSWEPFDAESDFAALFASVEIYRFDHEIWRKRRWERRLSLLPRDARALYSKPTLEAFHAWVREHSPDLIFVDEALVAPYAWPHTHIPAILARQKADYRYCWDVFRRAPWGRRKLGAFVEWLLFRAYEGRLWRRFRTGVVVSEEERQLYLEKWPGLQLAIVANGVDVAAIRPAPPPADDPPTILFHGLMSYYPNVDAATWFVEAVFPRVLEAVPEALLKIVGDSPSEAVMRLAQPDRVIVTGRVPDMRPHLEGSHVVVVPLRVGHGTRLKILEAFAASRAVVSTSIGAEGLRVERGTHLLVEDEAAGFAAAVARVLQDRDLREGLGRNARELAEESYSWEGIGAGLDRFCQELAAPKADTRAHRTSFVLPEGMRLGGVTTWSARMCRRLAERGRPTALLQHVSDGAPFSIPLPEGVLDIRCRNQRAPLHPATSTSDLQDFAREYRRALPGTVVPNWSQGTYATCALISTRAPDSLRVLGFAHTDEPEYYQWLSYYEPIVHRFVAVSAEVAAKLKERIPHRADHVLTRPYAVEMPEAARRAGYSAPGTPLRLVYAGRLRERQKRVSDLAGLAAILEREGVDFRLAIVGDGMDEQLLMDRLKALPKSARRRVEMSGLLPMDEMSAVWLGADVCILVSEYEGTSITMLEAMGCGCVPVVTEVSGTAAVIRPGRNGFTVPVGDLEAMARILKELGRDRGRLASLGAAARATVEPWSFDGYVDRFLGLVDEVWAEPARRWPSDRPLLPKPPVPVPPVA